ncbi:hypothetical protein J7M22_12020 [Candidatus Poribacteria bacterium]|nr:hypothetical protein [Candidatus Poribacteria bacterium]
MKILWILTLLSLWITAAEAGVWRDDFNGDQLDKRWRFDNRGNQGSTVSLKDGKLYMHVPAGNNDLIPGVDRAPTLTMPAPEGDYEVTTLYVGPTAGSAAAGIVIFQDILHQVQLLYGIGGGGGQRVWFFPIDCGVPPVKDKERKVRGVGWGHHLFTDVLGEQDKVYLKVERRGDTYISYYKLGDVEKWEQWLSADVPLRNAQVGLIVKNWGGSELTGTFDFFQIRGEGINFEVEPDGRLPTTWGRVKWMREGR